MEKNSNTSVSDSSMRRKVREALATCPVRRAINNRFSQDNQEPKTVAIDSNSASSKPRHVKVKKEEEDQVVPIEFDYSTPIWNESKNPPAAPGKVEAKGFTKVGFSGNADTGKQGKAVGETEQQGKKDMNYAFSEYIQRVKLKMRTTSFVGGGQEGEGAPDKEANNGYGGTRKKDNQKEHFSNFIHLARKKIRTITTIRRE